VQQNGFTLEYIPDEYQTEEFIFMAQQTRLWDDDIPTVLTTRIFKIYKTMGS